MSTISTLSQTREPGSGCGLPAAHPGRAASGALAGPSWQSLQHGPPESIPAP